MKELSIKSINEKAAYTVYTTTSKQDFSFLTEQGIQYAISFMEEFEIGGCMSYQFCINNHNKKHGSYDSKVQTTILCIIEEFFAKNSNILLYICDTSDNKEAARNRLFLRWFREYAIPNEYTICTANSQVEGEYYYTAIIIENKNPLKEQIIADFSKISSTLEK